MMFDCDAPLGMIAHRPIRDAKQSDSDQYLHHRITRFMMAKLDCSHLWSLSSLESKYSQAW